MLSVVLVGLAVLLGLGAGWLVVLVVDEFGCAEVGFRCCVRVLVEEGGRQKSSKRSAWWAECM